jgi:hypothetical protein
LFAALKHLAPLVKEMLTPVQLVFLNHFRRRIDAKPTKRLFAVILSRLATDMILQISSILSSICFERYNFDIALVKLTRSSTERILICKSYSTQKYQIVKGNWDDII